MVLERGNARAEEEEMAARKKTVRRTIRPSVRDERGRLARTWDDTREVLGMGRATLEKRARSLMKTSGVDPDKAADRLAALRRRLGLERRKAVKQVEGRLLVLRARAKKERRVLGHMVDDAVRRTLAALDMPSRQEVHELTRRIEELSRKIDGLRRTTPRPPAKKAIKRR
jgi:polyhydroxyalkanoate synthesis regulator phasin